MTCPHAHEWYELERGEVSRKEAERLRRHAASCKACRRRTEDLRQVAAGLERLANLARADLSAEGAEAVVRRARVHGLLGRPPREPLSARIVRNRWLRWAAPAAAVAAAVVLTVVGLREMKPETVNPRGAMGRLVAETRGARRATDLAFLALLARAAAGEELARPDASVDQVADLLLIAYSARHRREEAQVADIEFLMDGVRSRRPAGGGVARSFDPEALDGRGAVVRPRGSRRARPMLASVLAISVQSFDPEALDGVTPEDPRGVGASDPMAMARSLVLSGDYAEALSVLPAVADSPGREDTTAVLRAWCLEELGRTEDAVQVLDAAQNRPEGAGAGALVRVLRADLALGEQDVVEAIRQYETLAAENDRYWFSAGYLFRYELGDRRGAGERFQRVAEPRMAAYVAARFAEELAAAKEMPPAPMLEETFDSYALGVPHDWALVQIRSGEFQVVKVPGGRALEQDEARERGAEFLSGGSDWRDYTVQADVKVLSPGEDYVIGAAAYRQPGHKGYALELSPHRLRLVKSFAAEGGPPRGEAVGRGSRTQRLVLEPAQAQQTLEESPARGWWYTLKMRVQKVEGGVSVAGKMWRTDTPEPLDWQVVWTDGGQGGGPPIESGAAGIQISGAQVLIDNFVVTRNEAPRAVPAAE